MSIVPSSVRRRAELFTFHAEPLEERYLLSGFPLPFALPLPLPGPVAELVGAILPPAPTAAAVTIGLNTGDSLTAAVQLPAVPMLGDLGLPALGVGAEVNLGLPSPGVSATVSLGPVNPAESTDALLTLQAAVTLSVEDAGALAIEGTVALDLLGNSGVSLTAAVSLVADADGLNLEVHAGPGVGETEVPLLDVAAQVGAAASQLLPPDGGVEVQVTVQTNSPAPVGEVNLNVNEAANLGVGNHTLDTAVGAGGTVGLHLSATVPPAGPVSGDGRHTESMPPTRDQESGLAAPILQGPGYFGAGFTALVTAGTAGDQLLATALTPGVPSASSAGRTVEFGFGASRSDSEAAPTADSANDDNPGIDFFPLGLQLVVQAMPSHGSAEEGTDARLAGVAPEGTPENAAAAAFALNDNLEAQPADLVTSFAPFDVNSLSQAILQFLDELCGLGQGWLASLSRGELSAWALAAVAAAMACEVARRQVRRRRRGFGLAGADGISVWFVGLAGPPPGDER